MKQQYESKVIARDLDYIPATAFQEYSVDSKIEIEEETVIKGKSRYISKVAKTPI